MSSTAPPVAASTNASRRTVAVGVLADHTSILWVYKVIPFLPLLGMAAAFLPSRRTH
ncbi:hypothetical protein [Stenotrophomonas humi]